MAAGFIGVENINYLESTPSDQRYTAEEEAFYRRFIRSLGDTEPNRGLASILHRRFLKIRGKHFAPMGKAAFLGVMRGQNDTFEPDSAASTEGFFVPRGNLKQLIMGIGHETNVPEDSIVVGGVVSLTSSLVRPCRIDEKRFTPPADGQTTVTTRSLMIVHFAGDHALNQALTCWELPVDGWPIKDLVAAQLASPGSLPLASLEVAGAGYLKPLQ